MHFGAVSLLCASGLFVANALADFHAYVQAVYGNAPSSLTPYDPSTGELGDLSFVTQGQAVQVLGSPDGSQIWIIGLNSGLTQGFVSIYDTSKRTIVATLDLPGVAAIGCYESCPVGLFSPTGELFYAITDGAAGTNLLVYSVPARKLLGQTVLTGVGSVVSIAISPDGSRLFLNDRLQIAAVASATGKMLATLPIKTSTIASAGNMLLAPGFNTLIYIDMDTDTVKATIPTAASPGTITVSADGSKAVLKEEYTDNTGVIVYDVQTVDVLAQVITATGTLPGDVGLILSPDGTQLTVLGVSFKPEAGSVGVWVVESWNPESYDIQHSTRLFDNALVPAYAGSTLYLYFYSSLVSVVDGTTMAVTRQVPIGGGGAELATVPGESFVYAFTNGGLDLIWPGIDKPIPSLAVNYGFGATFSALGVSQTVIYGVGDGTSPLTAIGLFTGELYNLETPGFGQPPDCFNSLGTPLVSPDQKTMVLNIGYLCGPAPDLSVVRSAPSQTEATSGLAIYTTSTNRLRAQVAVNSSGPVIISPDSTTVYVTASPYCCGSGTSQLSAVTLATATVANVWNLPQNPVFASLAISPDGKTIYASALVNNVGDILVIDSVTGAVTNLFPISATAASIALSPDGSELIIAGFQGSESNSLGFMNLHSGAIAYVNTGYPLTGPVVVTN